MIQQSCHGKA